MIRKKIANWIYLHPDTIKVVIFIVLYMLMEYFLRRYPEEVDKIFSPIFFLVG